MISCLHVSFMLLSDFHTLRLIYINLTTARWKRSLLNNAYNSLSISKSSGDNGESRPM